MGLIRKKDVIITVEGEILPLKQAYVKISGKEVKIGIPREYNLFSGKMCENNPTKVLSYKN